MKITAVVLLLLGVQALNLNQMDASLTTGKGLAYESHVGVTKKGKKCAPCGDDEDEDTDDDDCQCKKKKAKKTCPAEESPCDKKSSKETDEKIAKLDEKAQKRDDQRKTDEAIKKVSD